LRYAHTQKQSNFVFDHFKSHKNAINTAALK